MRRRLPIDLLHFYGLQINMYGLRLRSPTDWGMSAGDGRYLRLWLVHHWSGRLMLPQIHHWRVFQIGDDVLDIGR